MKFKNKYHLERFTRHCQELEALGAEDGVEAYNKLLSLENRAHKVAEDDCNFGMEEEVYEKRMDKIRDAVSKIFGKLPEGFFINGDPRGYALKIKEEDNKLVKGQLDDGISKVISYTDWGGYGILAPEISE